MKRFLTTILVALLPSFALAADYSFPKLPDPVLGRIPPKAAEPWIALAVLGKRNQPIPVTFFLTKNVNTKPEEWTFTHWVRVTPNVFQWLIGFTRTWPCRQARDVPRENPASTSGGNWLDISEQEKGRWVHLCLLHPAEASKYLAALLANPEFEWSTDRAEGITQVLNAYREGRLN